MDLKNDGEVNIREVVHFDKNNPKTLLTAEDKDVLIVSIGNTHIRWFYHIQRKTSHTDIANSKQERNYYWKTVHIPKYVESERGLFDFKRFLHETVLDRFQGSEIDEYVIPLKMYVSSVVPEQIKAILYELCRHQLPSIMISLCREDFIDHISCLQGMRPKVGLNNTNTFAWKTLGVDRLCGLCGAHGLFQSANNDSQLSMALNNFLVIDGGTCSTFLVSINGDIVGGAILPGIKQKLEGLRIYTPCLPHINFEELYKYARRYKYIDMPVFEKGTNDNMCCGILGEFKRNFVGIIDAFLSEVECMERARIVITGGDGMLLYSLLTGKEVEKSQKSSCTAGIHGRPITATFDEFLLEHGILNTVRSLSHGSQ